MPASRVQDERLLAMLRLRADGKTVQAVADRLGVNRVWVQKATSAVLAADIAESGAPEPAVRRAYW